LVGYSDEQLGELKYNPITRVTARVTEPKATNSAEQAQDDPMIALRQARALIAASVCKRFFPSDGQMTTQTQDPVDWEMSSKSRGADGPTSGNCLDQREQLPPSIHRHKGRSVVLDLPSLLRGRNDSCGGSPHLDHPHTAHPSGGGVQWSTIQEKSSLIDDKVSGACSSSAIHDFKSQFRIVH